MPPSGFSWVDPPRLAALARPQSAEDLLWLRRNGIDVLVSLTENPLPRQWVNDTGMLAVAVPEFLVGKGKGWLTAEYSMLPGSTAGRKARDKAGKVDGRSVEIQRLIGRSLRAVVDLSKLGERTLWFDCDVLQADGGTRTAAISGAYVAVVDALTATAGANVAAVVRDSVAAVSVGIVDGEARLDLEYIERWSLGLDFRILLKTLPVVLQAEGN